MPSMKPNNYNNTPSVQSQQATQQLINNWMKVAPNTQKSAPNATKPVSQNKEIDSLKSLNKAQFSEIQALKAELLREKAARARIDTRIQEVEMQIKLGSQPVQQIKLGSQPVQQRQIVQKPVASKNTPVLKNNVINKNTPAPIKNGPSKQNSLTGTNYTPAPQNKLKKQASNSSPVSGDSVWESFFEAKSPSSGKPTSSAKVNPTLRPKSAQKNNSNGLRSNSPKSDKANELSNSNPHYENYLNPSMFDLPENYMKCLKPASPVRRSPVHKSSSKAQSPVNSKPVSKAQSPINSKPAQQKINTAQNNIQNKSKEKQAASPSSANYEAFFAPALFDLPESYLKSLRPASPVQKSMVTAQRPTSPQQKPASPQQKLATPASKPIAAAQRPASPQQKLATPASKPIAAAQRPVSPQAKPMAAVQRPASPQQKQATSASKPIAAAQRPASPQPKPMAAAQKPASPQPKPMAAAQKP
ncbi:hypothetical protein HK099_005531, partial [Clydaea vesicula]